jgi:hypothetical protein
MKAKELEQPSLGQCPIDSATTEVLLYREAIGFADRFRKTKEDVRKLLAIIVSGQNILPSFYFDERISISSLMQGKEVPTDEGLSHNNLAQIELFREYVKRQGVDTIEELPLTDIEKLAQEFALIANGVIEGSDEEDQLTFHLKERVDVTYNLPKEKKK